MFPLPLRPRNVMSPDVTVRIVATSRISIPCFPVANAEPVSASSVMSALVTITSALSRVIHPPSTVTSPVAVMSSSICTPPVPALMVTPLSTPVVVIESLTVTAPPYSSTAPAIETELPTVIAVVLSACPTVKPVRVLAYVNVDVSKVLAKDCPSLGRIVSAPEDSKFRGLLDDKSSAITVRSLVEAVTLVLALLPRVILLPPRPAATEIP